MSKPPYKAPGIPERKGSDAGIKCALCGESYGAMVWINATQAWRCWPHRNE